jgi:preprotein translocase subunit SecG
MVQILITAGIFFLIIVSLFLILVVLMQRANSDGGLGTAFGSTITESAFGTEAGNVMTKITRITFIVFFAVAFILYLAILAEQNHKATPQKSLFESEAAAETQVEKAAVEQPAPSADKAHADQPTTPAPAVPAK